MQPAAGGDHNDTARDPTSAFTSMFRQHHLALGCALGDAGATTIASLPVDLIATHILRHVRDPMDLARLSAVSRGMRAAVDATGREIADVADPWKAETLGFFTTLRHMHSRGRLKSTDHDMLCNAAARSGQFEELKALRAENWPWSAWTCAKAARGGHLEVLKWARENDCPWDAKTCAGAAWGGHLEMLKWARKNGCPWDVNTCAGAATGGHLEILKWLRQNGCPWDERTCAFAAKGGHLEMLKWARENGCPWSAWTCAEAAEYGHLETLKWARENGCPWDAETLVNAVTNEHYDVLRWALANDCPCDDLNVRLREWYLEYEDDE
jgi:hypothetical protein